jgi:hypothetical protein
MTLGLAGAAWSQTAIDLRTQTKDVDFSGAVSTKPFKTGTSLPSTCTTGAAFLNLAATAGQNIYLCTATNTWTQVQEGNQAMWGSGSRPAAANALGTSGDCVAWGSVGLVDAGAPCGSGSGSGSGASMFQQLGDFALTYAGTSGTIGASCSPTTPCIAAVGYGAYSFTSAATVTASGSGADTYYIYVNSGGTRMVGYGGSAAPVCSGCTVMAGIASYPAGAATIGRFTVSGGQIVAAVSDRAAVSGPPTLVAGSNVSISTAGNVVTISSTGGGSGSLPSTVVETNQSNAYTAGTQDFRLANHTLPVVTGTAAGKPSTCIVGEQYFATDATAGQNLYLCTGTNTWTQMSGGSGTGTFDPTNWSNYDSGRLGFMTLGGNFTTGLLWDGASVGGCGAFGADSTSPAGGYMTGEKWQAGSGNYCWVFAPHSWYGPNPNTWGDFASGSSPQAWQLQGEYRLPTNSSSQGTFYMGILQSVGTATVTGAVLTYAGGGSYTCQILNSGTVVGSATLSTTPDTNYHHASVGNGGTANSVTCSVGSSSATATGTIPAASGGWYFAFGVEGTGGSAAVMGLSEAEITIKGRSTN